MNANKLADYLDSNVGASVDEDNKYIDQAATMLRQQQAEIEALKANFNKENPVKEVFNTEPVAWLIQAKTWHEFTFSKPAEDSEDVVIEPLYTHSAKTLTDEFIYKNHVGYLSPNNDFYAPDYPTWKQDGFTPIYKEPVAKTLTDEEILDALQDALNGWKYIRECHGDLYGVGWDRVQDKIEAILRKAQEK